MIKQWLKNLEGTKWSGKGELWLDPEGNVAEEYDCKLAIAPDGIYYSWSYENETQKGSFTFNESGAVWVDTWHQPESLQCINTHESLGIFNVNHAYEVPNNPNWSWQSRLSERPDASIVLQMTNITPWGEDGRAVRMVFINEKA